MSLVILITIQLLTSEMRLYTTVVLFCGSACFFAGAMATDDLETCEVYSSCKEAYEVLKCGGKNPKSGDYLLRFNVNNNRFVQKVYCDMEGVHCGKTGGWMRVAAMDMTNPNEKCPPGLDEGMYDTKKLCGNRGIGCKSAFFSTYGIPYMEVCGFVAGYQYKSPDGFIGTGASIEGAYLDGISITYDKSPRKHIWSYVAGVSSQLIYPNTCPCNTGTPNTVPPFADNHWYCESGNPTKDVLYKFFGNDVLWDGKKCTGKEPPCCTNPSLPYFYRNLNDIAMSPIELRICHNQGFDDEDVPIESYVFYVR